MSLRAAAFALSFCLAFASSLASALPIWTEDVDGDLSSSAGAPTPLSIALGTNTVSGSVSAASDDTRDYLTFTIGAGQQLSALLLQQWADGTSGGPANTGFHAINLGATSFVPGQATIASFLGAAHIDFLPAGSDLLPGLGTGGFGEIGFVGPLGPGTYSYVIQQTGPELNRYVLDFVVTPEPGTAVLFGLGMAGLSAAGRRGSRLGSNIV